MILKNLIDIIKNLKVKTIKLGSIYVIRYICLGSFVFSLFNLSNLSNLIIQTKSLTLILHFRVELIVFILSAVGYLITYVSEGIVKHEVKE